MLLHSSQLMALWTAIAVSIRTVDKPLFFNVPYTLAHIMKRNVAANAPFLTVGISCTTAIAAVSYEVAKNVWFIPNVKYAFYDKPDEGDKPENDMYANMTVWFKF